MYNKHDADIYLYYLIYAAAVTYISNCANTVAPSSC